MTTRLANKLLYIADLAQRLAAMDAGVQPLHALRYRVLAKRLREAAAGIPTAALAARFGSGDHLVATVVENRHFDHHGSLPGGGAMQGRAAADTLFCRLGVRRPPAHPAPLYTHRSGG